MKNNTERIGFVRAALKAHDDYWTRQQTVMAKLKNAYNNDFYRDQQYLIGTNDLPVESAIAYEHVESTVGSLFTQAPGVVVAEDQVVASGDPIVAQTLVNRFLQRKRQSIEQACRLSLIYPCSFLKLAPRDSLDPLERVDIRAIEPWNIIVDNDADCWENQRYVGHIYWLTIPEAKKRFGQKDFKAIPKKDYFDRQNYIDEISEELPEDFLYIQCVELYDLVHDSLLFWSPNWNGGEALLDKTEIPVKDWDGKSLPAIVPLYFSSDPSRPMIGYSSLSRIYDQIKEHNLLRSRMASAVRKDARMFIYDKSIIDGNNLEQIARGEDGTLIGVDGNAAGAISLIPNPSVNPDHTLYLSQIERDLVRGSIQAPFTKGQATQSTATEVVALQTYTHSEIGRLARCRDEAIERLANIYIRIIGLAITPEENVIITTDEGPKIVDPVLLEGKFNIAALDAGNSPIGDLMKQKALTSLVQPLTFLGANREVLLEELIKVYKLSSELTKKAEPPAMPGLPGMSAPAEGEPPTQPLGPLSATALRGLLPIPPG